MTTYVTQQQRPRRRLSVARSLFLAGCFCVRSGAAAESRVELNIDNYQPSCGIVSRSVFSTAS
jgi:hypothetical protein